MNLLQRSISSLKENNKGPAPGFFVSVMAVTLFTAFLPLFTFNCIQGHDMEYHLLRMEALKTGIVNGLPFLRVNLLFFGGEGYASSLFYPDFLLYIPAFLRSIGLGINLSWHIFVGFCIAASFVSMYLSMKYITDSAYSALISAVAFTLCRYHLDDIYTRAAVGEYCAMIFIPLVAAGLFDLTEREFKRPWLLAGGMAGVLLCHSISFIFCLILCVIALIIRFRLFLQEPLRLLKLFLTALVTLCLTAFYWIPVLEQLSITEFRYLEPVFDVDHEKLLLKDIFAPEPGRMGITLFLLILTGLLISHAGDRLVRTADVMVLTGLFFALCSTGFFPWGRLKSYVSGIQFPWRLFIVTSVLLSMAAGIYVEKLSEKYKDQILLFVTAIMILSAVLLINRTDTGYYSYSDDYFDQVKYTNTVIGGEWLPKKVEDRKALGGDADNAYDDKGNSIPVARKGNRITFNASGQSFIDVPFIYYPGYFAYDGKGKDLETSGDGKNGRVRVVSPGEETVTVYYKGTALQHISDIISIITLLGIGVYLVLKRRKTKAAS